MGRNTGSKNVIPTESEQNNLLHKLRENAEKGDSTAIGFLLLLCEMKKQFPH